MTKKVEVRKIGGNPDYSREYYRNDKGVIFVKVSVKGEVSWFTTYCYGGEPVCQVDKDICFEIEHPLENCFKRMPLSLLLEFWAQTENEELTITLCELRGFIMKSIKARDSVFYEKWLYRDTLEKGAR